ncbi:PREDICTED: uncharacterized protein LOC109208553 [Nicotiana attenuata]|uniref:uncharacterized protein LOC109208553 n=1 Tax=Nicotiana attenuata TaxID=49451 RepID=UPI0009048FF7|nr:PREDICTED: uncharacterized protein LOC109208553 [Nicotiana attenuata]
MGDNTEPTVNQTATAVVSIIDSNHDYFLHSSDAPGISLVNTVFDGRGFQGSKDFQQWNRCNDMVTSWLLNSLSKDIGDSVIYSKFAKDLWTSLEHKFVQSNGAKLYHLRKELSGLAQGTSDIASYFTKLKRLWDELDSLNCDVKCNCLCVCEGRQKLEKLLEDERLIQFLMGLNDSYGQARGNILMMNPLPNINHAYSLELQDESQKEIYVNPLIPPDSSVFMIKTQGNFAQKGEKQNQKGNTSYPRFGNNMHKGTNNFNQRNPTFKGKKSKFNPNVSCSHCKKVGHTVNDCYRIIGFPEDFEFTKGNQMQVRGNGAFQMGQAGNNNTGQDEMISQHLSQDQFSQLVQLIKQVKVGDSANSGAEINVNAVAGTIARYSGTCFSAPLVKRAQVFGEAREGLYLLKPSQDKNRTEVESSLCLDQNISSQLSVSVPFSANAISDVNLWHVRLGHLPFSSMKHLSFISLPSNSNCFCDICPKARQTRTSFPLSQIKTKKPFELIHVDVWGLYKVATYNGFKYFLTIVDDYSRGAWTFLMSTKCNAFGLLKNFFTMVERQFGLKVQKLRTDNAFKLGKGSLEASFLSSQGIMHQTSCVATPQQNGVVERKHRHHLEIARALLFQSKNPSYDSLKCFGCLCYVSTLSAGRGKLDPRAKPCVFMGYPLGQKGYKVLDLETKRMTVSRDVQFYENQYPFAYIKLIPNSIFLIPPTSNYEPPSDHVQPDFVTSVENSQSLTQSSNHNIPHTPQSSSTPFSPSSPHSPLPITFPEIRKSTKTHNNLHTYKIIFSTQFFLLI